MGTVSIMHISGSSVVCCFPISMWKISLSYRKVLPSGCMSIRQGCLQPLCRLSMMHSHIKPSVTKKTAIEKKKRDNASDMIGRSQQKEKPKGAGQTSSYETVYDTVQKSDNDCVIHSADKGDVPDWTFLELAEYAKRNQCDVLSLLKGKISITEIAV